MRSTQLRQFVRAPRSVVYRTLLDPQQLSRWKVPDGMTCKVHEFEPREGGRIRVSLTYDSPSPAGKTTFHTDTYHGRFSLLIADEKVVEVDEFETSDGAFQGEMTITWTLTDVADGTEIHARHENVPSGVSLKDNELGWSMALAKLAALCVAEV
jgi:uncharacterized protein YndB with AHSA1/START domain